MNTSFPFVSVAIRSYRRLPQLIELVQRVQRQEYPNFEIVVIEQSAEEREAQREALNALSADPRVRILEYPALGAGRARDEAAKQARGEIVLFVDDDDVPVGTDWLRSHAENYSDPNCMAVTGRQLSHEGEDSTRHDTRRNHRLCLRYSWLKMPRSRARHTLRIQGVTQIAGSNASIRKSAILRAGGWDHERDHDEDSFNFRFARIKRPGEYFAYDPKPAIVRRLDVPGGVGRRQLSFLDLVRSELRFSHGVIRKYFPLRFYALYPVYLLIAMRQAGTYARRKPS